MATILIVSKTKMRNGVCIGGIDEQSGDLIHAPHTKSETDGRCR